MAPSIGRSGTLCHSRTQRSSCRKKHRSLASLHLHLHRHEHQWRQPPRTSQQQHQQRRRRFGDKLNHHKFVTMPKKRGVREVPSSPEREVITLSGDEDEDDDDEQGTADLTLHILAKAEELTTSRGERERERSDGAAAEVIALDDSDDQGLEEGELDGGAEARAELDAAAVVVAMGRKKKKKKEKKEKRMKEKNAKVVNMEDTKTELDESLGVKLPDAEESLAMRKLLRGPRYFDPPEEQGDTCYSCGQQGHKAAACTEQPRQKPCYVCGNFGHDGYDCPEKTECFECGKSGHVARSCPDKRFKLRRKTGLCLLCGRLGHGAATCSRDYDPDDLKQVQCYICKRTGHLCCIEVVDASPTPVSCFQCGDLGHSGASCKRQTGDRGDNSACYKCGQEGHFARECHQNSRDYNIKQRRHSWPAPWSADNGRYGDREPPFTPACQSRIVPFKKRLEQASSGKLTVESRRGSKQKRKETDDDRWTPKSTDNYRKRSRD